MPPPTDPTSLPRRVWRWFPRRTRIPALIAAAMMLYSVVVMVPAAASASSEVLIERGWPTARGEVISYETRTTRSTRGRTTVRYHEVVAYTADGGDFRVRAVNGNGSPPVIGSEVTVRYRPGRPEDGRIAGDTLSGAVQRAVGALALILVPGAMVLLVSMGTRRREARRNDRLRPGGWAPPGWATEPHRATLIAGPTIA